MDCNQNSPSKAYLEADQPIEHRQDDRLGRKAFAESVAQQIRNVPSGASFTVAVTGEWGSGKTSVINMVAETLECDSSGIAVLRFNPWLFGGVGELVTRFFQELSIQLGQNNTQKLKDVAKLLAKFGQALAPLSPVPGTTVAANLAASVVVNWAKQPSLYSEYAQLKKALEVSESRVVVLIDDIDRLEPAETREVMRLVRLTSDLPNVVFLLAFDRENVANSLSKSGADGSQYLEKIVQVSFNLPILRETILPDTLVSLLDEFLRGREVRELGSHVWQRVFYEIIRPLLGNLRDVKRYLYSLPVTLDLVGREVALADLLGLEAIRVLRPALFENLRNHSKILVHCSSDLQLVMGSANRKQEINQELTKMLEDAAADRALLDSVFTILFPATQEFLTNNSYGSTSTATWRKDRRVACEEVLRFTCNPAWMKA